MGNTCCKGSSTPPIEKHKMTPLYGRDLSRYYHYADWRHIPHGSLNNAKVQPFDLLFVKSGHYCDRTVRHAAKYHTIFGLLTHVGVFINKTVFPDRRLIDDEWYILEYLYKADKNVPNIYGEFAAGVQIRPLRQLIELNRHVHTHVFIHCPLRPTSREAILPPTIREQNIVEAFLGRQAETTHHHDHRVNATIKSQDLKNITPLILNSPSTAAQVDQHTDLNIDTVRVAQIANNSNNTNTGSSDSQYTTPYTQQEKRIVDTSSVITTGNSSEDFQTSERCCCCFGSCKRRKPKKAEHCVQDRSSSSFRKSQTNVDSADFVFNLFTSLQLYQHYNPSTQTQRRLTSHVLPIDFLPGVTNLPVIVSTYEMYRIDPPKQPYLFYNQQLASSNSAVDSLFGSKSPVSIMDTSTWLSQDSTSDIEEEYATDSDIY